MGDTLSVDSLSVEPQSEWPVDSGVGLVAASKFGMGIYAMGPGEALPTANVSGTWSGDIVVQTNFDQ